MQAKNSHKIKEIKTPREAVISFYRLMLQMEISPLTFINIGHLKEKQWSLPLAEILNLSRLIHSDL